MYIVGNMLLHKNHTRTFYVSWYFCAAGFSEEWAALHLQEEQVAMDDSKVYD